jgi:hypothetical protein
LRTVFLCDQIAIEEFRREIHTLLNRGESVHHLQRAIYYGKVSHERGRRRDEMKVISGSHALLTNIVLAWNAAQMQVVVDRLRKESQVHRRQLAASHGARPFRPHHDGKTQRQAASMRRDGDRELMFYFEGQPDQPTAPTNAKRSEVRLQRKRFVPRMPRLRSSPACSCPR